MIVTYILALIGILIRSDSSHSAMTNKLILLGTCINKEIWIWQRISERFSAKVFSTQLEVHNSFEPLSIWKTTQAFHGKGLHGNKRNHDDAILHASVKGKLAMAPSYGGKTRAQLDGLVADERIWGVFGVGPNLPIVFM